VGIVRRIGILASQLGAAAYEHRVVALSSRGPDPQSIGRLSQPCTALASGRRLRIALAWGLHRLLRDVSADVVHAWSSNAGRIARTALLGLDASLIEASPAELCPGIDATRLREEIGEGILRPRLVAELGLPREALVMGTAGRLAREKQVIELLWALDQIRCVRDDVYLLVIGDGDARPLFERYARLYEVADHVRFLGWRSNAAAIIAALDVYCTASIQPGRSLAVLEAMALGVPVIASDTPPHRQLVANGETGFLVDTGQRSEMARWCLRVLEDKELTRRMSDAAQQRAIEQFPVDSFVEQCRRLYEEGATT
jgi:glycosyltransferase involved in cell wall biosynthesis